MILSDVTNFLLPDFSDPIQSVFFGVMVSLTIGIIICAQIYACDSKWDKKWTGEKGQKANENLDIEHGSVMDLSHAVATAPEKLADVMPGLLLIIGLLGTFLGLGLALDNASSILSKPNSLSASAASNSMQDLLNMLQGLGTKFKTSTWGIFAFIVLKTWSEFTRFEEKRLSWVIRKVKLELDFRKQEIKSVEEAKTVRVIQAISDGSNQTSGALTGAIADILELLTQQENARIERQNNSDIKFNEFISRQTLQLSAAGESINKSLTTLTNIIVENITKSEIRSSELVNAVQGGFGGTGVLLNAIRSELETSSKTITEFSINTQTLITEMSTASSQMAEGAKGVGIAANELVGVVQTFESKFTEVLDQIGADLGKAINEMSLQAATTLENGSNKLHAATSEISTALGKLSNDVQGTMQEVQGSITKALDIQQESSRRFILSSDSLAEKTQESIDIIKRLTSPIELGLSAISSSNREQASVYRKLDESIKTFHEMLETLSTFSKVIAPIESISENLGKSLLKIDGIQDSVASLANSEGYHDAINSIKNSMQYLEKQMSSVRFALQSNTIQTSA